MKVVEPIRDKAVLFAMLDYLKAKSERDYMLFMVGINTGLRVSDILDLKVCDLKGKKDLALREKKTGKAKTIPINADLFAAVKQYTKDKESGAWMFPSRENASQHIKRSRAYKILRNTAEIFGISNVGTHTMRKTFGYHFYHQNEHDVSLLMEIFNHSEPSITLRYIGVTSEAVSDAMQKFSLALPR